MREQLALRESPHFSPLLPGPQLAPLRPSRASHRLECARLSDVKGRLSLAKTEAPSVFERAQYIRTLSDWSSWLAYQAYLRTHKDVDSKPPS